MILWLIVQLNERKKIETCCEFCDIEGMWHARIQPLYNQLNDCDIQIVARCGIQIYHSSLPLVSCLLSQKLHHRR